jgi:hypothetical protein
MAPENKPSDPPAPPKIGPAERRDRFQRTVLWVTQSFKFASYCVKWGVIAFLGYCAYLSIAELAGKTTIVEAAIQFMARVHLSEAAAWAAALIMGGGWYRTYRAILRLRRENLPRLAEMEKELDPDRTSSGLDERGEDPDSEK